VAELVGSLDTGQMQTVHASLGPSPAPHEHDGALELPWTAVVTRAA
jgi:hypothetical protein